MLTLNYKDGRSIHQQIKDGLKELIVSGIYSEGEQLPSVRELSVSLTVNPNTVQRAYRELESEGYIYSVKGKGNFVASLEESKNQERIDELYGTITSAIKELAFLREPKENLLNVINNIYEEGESDK